ncbi:MAG: T9SS type A sorting domain-containing protein, partial [Bacteroidales bacterium]|nr:T9SS type A sorting domain-containing protein [Bacteroidales bacterium]
TGITTTISTTNPYVTITDDNEACGNIAGNSSAAFPNAYAFLVADSIPDQEQVTFNLEIRDINDTIWNSSFTVTLQAPELQVTTITVDDAAGNNNGRLDPGETVNLIFNTTNNGHSISPNAIGTLGSSSSDITINNSPVSLSTINTTTPVQASFSVDVSTGAQIGSSVDFYYQTNASPYTADKWVFLPIGLIVEDWETGDFTQFEWTTSGTQPWFIDNSMYYEGINSSRSGNITDDQSSVMEIEIDVTSADTLSFYKKVSCEDSQYSGSGYWYDYLKFEVDGNTQGQWDGIIDWSREAYYLTTGTHTLKWTYYKDASVAEGDDAAWVDFVVFPPIDMSTIINEHEVDNTSLSVYPNPSKDFVNIHYSLKEKSTVTIKLYNINGQQIAILLNKTKRNQGEYTQIVTTNNLQSGVYYIRVDMDNTTFVKRLIIQ